MKTKTISFFFLALISAVALAFLIFNTFNLTGNIVLQSENYVGNNLTGKINIILEEGNTLNKDITILISLIKNNTVIKVETITLDKFVRLSDLETKPIDSIYKTSETFSVNLEDIFLFTSNESGEYELLFSILELDINTKEIFDIT